MKIVLLEDVKNIGRIGDIADVPNGYGRNFLIPRGMAEVATRSIMRSGEFRQKVKVNEERRDRAEAEGLAEVLQGVTITIGAQVGAQNRLHGEVTNQDVSQAIQDELGIEIDRHKIEIERPIRSLGIFMLPVRIAKGLEASITIEILEESELAARQAAAAAEEAAARAEQAAMEAEEARESESGVEYADRAEQIPDSDLEQPDESPA